MKKSLYNGLVLLAVVIALVSCDDDIRVGGNAQSKNKISFMLGVGKTSKTRSDAAPLNFSLDGQVIDGKAVCLTQEVSTLNAPEVPDRMSTRGTPVFTENFKDVLGTFTAACVYNGTNRITDLEGNFAWESTSGDGLIFSKQYNDELVWPTSGKVLYFLQAPATMPAGIGTPTYSTTTGAITFTVGDSYPKNAVNQTDILFTSKEIDIPKDGIDDEVHRILFYHVFSGVKFKIKDEMTGTRITAINSVTFTNLINKGTCTVTPSYEGDTFGKSNADGGTEKSATQSVWTYGPTPSTGEFSQTFTTAEQGVDLTTGASGYSYPESFKTATSNKGKNLNNAKATKTFYLIPQTLTDNVMLTITYTYNDGVTETEGTATIPFGKKTNHVKWEAGKLYTYSLSIGDKVDVAIDDVVAASTHKKSNLIITNTASATSYMRAAVIGNWFYDGDLESEIPEGGEAAPIAITPVDETSFRALVDGAMNAKWYKGADGYYYYRYPVPGGKTIQPENTLFGTLDLNSQYTDHKPYERCHLEVTICVQAVRASDVDTAWPGIKTAAGLQTTAID